MTINRAAIYARISRDAEDTGLGVARQLKECQALADAKGWTVAEVFTDNDISASGDRPRPAYQDMARAVEAGRINGIIAWDVDRLTRKPRELEDVIDWADKYGLALASVGGEIDLGTPQGRMMARIKGTVARHEVEQSSRRIKAKIREMAEDGLHTGPRPYGWDVLGKGQLAINEAEAAVVREAHAKALSGRTIHSIAKELNERGVPALRGGKWTPTTLRGTLARWRNAGVRVHDGKPLGPAAWEPLVSVEDQERMIAMLGSPSDRRRGGRTPKYLLTGLLVCSACGEKMYRKLGNKRVKGYGPDTYSCTAVNCGSAAQSRARLDELASELVISIMESQGVRILGGNEEALSAARSKVEALEAKLMLAADQFSDDAITGEQLRRITEKLKPQLEQAKAEELSAMPAGGPDGLSEAAPRSWWESADLQDRRALVKLLMDRGMRVVVSQPGREAPGRFNLERIKITPPT